MMPSEHSSDDIKWDQNISKPIRDTINAKTHASYSIILDQELSSE